MEEDVKFKSVISLVAAMLLAVSCGTSPENDGYTVASVDEQIERLEQEQGEDKQQEGQEDTKQDLVAPVAGGAVAVICAVVPGCRGVIKNGMIKIKDGSGKVIAVIKKPFQKLFKKSDEAADAAKKADGGAGDATKTADNTDGGQGAEASQEATDGK